MWPARRQMSMTLGELKIMMSPESKRRDTEFVILAEFGFMGHQDHWIL